MCNVWAHNKFENKFNTTHRKLFIDALQTSIDIELIEARNRCKLWFMQFLCLVAFKRLQRDSNPQPLSSLTNTQPFWPNWPKDWVVLWLLICKVHLIVCSYHVTHTFQSESILHSCLNVKDLLARNSRNIWNLSDCNGTRTHDHLVRKRTLNHLAKLTKWVNS